jgi:hypothetical protein
MWSLLLNPQVLQYFLLLLKRRLAACIAVVAGGCNKLTWNGAWREISLEFVVHFTLPTVTSAFRHVGHPNGVSPVPLYVGGVVSSGGGTGVRDCLLFLSCPSRICRCSSSCGSCARKLVFQQVDCNTLVTTVCSCTVIEQHCYLLRGSTT